ncbi:DUF4062 domain-containing protein [Vibrio metschnikovii]|uniref:DUF4062 domain-containing protein n=1 Tax=Vibrio metschnikovii TaxID=28172 RepID=UPI001C2FAC95
MNSTKYQVFISSTYTDLAQERESIIKAILEMYHIPIGMEMFSAEDEEQWEIIRRTIEVSDYYILILGLRYGSKTSDGISFTQKEYEYALENKIPILAFVMDEQTLLPRDKRDDDLTEINKFREIVLRNSKMAQFWETKDQLIKNVSISLMKQIMQKPGIGWVRGDIVGSEEALLKELTNLSKENRTLREKVLELESKVSIKIPKIKVNIAFPSIGDSYHSFEKLLLPEKISVDDVQEYLKAYVSEEAVDNYNSCIPTQADLDKYNVEKDKIYKVKNFSVPLDIDIANGGTCKANNLYIDIRFPDDLIVYEEGKQFKEPNNPIPFNPIVKAKREYEEEMKKNEKNHSLLPPYHDPFAFRNQLSQLEAIARPMLDMPKIRSVNQNWWTNLDGNKLTIKINNLLHTRRMKFNDEYMIAPLKSGIHEIEVRVICEEYDKVETHTIEVQV